MNEGGPRIVEMNVWSSLDLCRLNKLILETTFWELKRF